MSLVSKEEETSYRRGAERRKGPQTKGTDLIVETSP